MLYELNARKIHESLIIVRTAPLDTPLFGDIGRFWDFLGFLGSVLFFFIRRTDTELFVRVPSYFEVPWKSVVMIDIFCFLRFWDFSGWVARLFRDFLDLYFFFPYKGLILISS